MGGGAFVNKDDLDPRYKRPYFAFGALAFAIVAIVVVVLQTNRDPRTDDASVRANYVQFAPEVSGRIVSLPITDNALVQQGSVLFVIDSRPYEYALQQAMADQQLLEKQIEDAQRRIAAESSGVEAAKAALAGSETQTLTAASSTEASHAAVERAQASLDTAEAQKQLARNDLQRIEPLLAKQYVTPEQVDTARTK